METLYGETHNSWPQSQKPRVTSIELKSSPDTEKQLRRHREIMAEYYDLFYPSPLGPSSAPTRNPFPWLAED